MHHRLIEIRMLIYCFSSSFCYFTLELPKQVIFFSICKFKQTNYILSYFVPESSNLSCLCNTLIRDTSTSVKLVLL